jgi:L-alanine-DL-glutamate epimerase-like enolase superfamily enzyme
VIRGARIEEVRIDSLDLTLRSTFRTHWKTIRSHSTLRVRLRAGGQWGEGEAYTMSPAEGLGTLRELRLEGGEPRALLAIVPRIPGLAARSAVDMALHDLASRLAGEPLHRWLGLPRVSGTTCVSVGLDEPSVMMEAAKRWISQGYPIVKIKVTGSTGLDLIPRIREMGGPSLRIWVDANQGFDARGLLVAAEVFRRAGVELIEQPLPVGRVGEYAALRADVGLPIYLDEEIKSAEDVAAAIVAGGIDGINVKLAKLGGIRESLRAIRLAKRHGLSVMLGCFFESSLGISAPTHLLALSDRVDLDAPLFLEEDPYQGLRFEGAAIAPPEGPGLGVAPR